MQWPVSPIHQPHRDVAVVWGPRRALCPWGGAGDAFTSCSQPSQQRRGGKLGAVAWNGPAGVSPGFITLPVAAGQR